MKHTLPLVVLLLIGLDLLAQQEQSIQNFNLSQGLRFEENKGQVADSEGNVRTDILFTLKDKGINLYFTKTGIHYQWYYTEELMDGPYRISEATGLPIKEEGDQLPEKFKEPKPTRLHTYRVDMQWLNTNESVEVIAEQPFEDYNNYYHAHCPEGITHVKNYARLTYKDMYPGIDVVYYIKDGHLKYDVLVSAGADLTKVKFSYDGATPELINGKLRLETPLGFLEEQEPVAWDRKGDQIKIQYSKISDAISFDKAKKNELDYVIDPMLIWSTYYGGTSTDHGRAIVVDGVSNSYLVGYTSSTASIASGGHQNTIASSQDAFLVKFNVSGVRQWGTYYGGTGADYCFSAAVDGSGNIYIAGYTSSSTSISSGGHQNVIGGAQDSFMAKFNDSGVRQWGTYYGGANSDQGISVATDGSGNIYLAGQTQSSSAIASGGHQNTIASAQDGYLVKFNTSGVRQWGTYYGGTGADNVRSVATDGSSNVYLVGDTNSTTAIAISGHQNTIGGGLDAFLVKFNSSGVRQWGTYYGGGTVSDNDYGESVTTDASGNIYLAGQTQISTSIASGGHQNTYGGGGDAFLVKFNSSGVRQWGSYYGGTGSEIGQSVATDGLGNIYLAGHTSSGTAIANGGYQDTFGGGNYDAFVVKFNTSGVRQWGTYYGGTSTDYAYSVIIGGTDIIYLVGQTDSETGIASGGHMNVIGGGFDSFLVKLESITEPTAQPTSLVFGSVTSTSMTVSYTAATGSPAGYLVVRKSGSAPTTDPVDGTAYSVSGPLGDGTIAYVGSAVTFNETGLAASTTYHYKIYSYNGSGATINYRQASPLTGSQATSAGGTAEPTAQPTNLLFSSVTSTSMTVSYTAATGLPAGYLVVRKSGSAPTTDPVDGTAYSVSGPLGDGTIAYVGSAVTFNETGLAASTTYHYKIYSYNGSGATINYRQTSPLTGSQVTLATEPTAQPTNLMFSNITSTSMTVSYTAATGSPTGYLAIRRSGSAATVDPVDGTVYTIGGAIGDGTIAYAGSAVTFNETALTASTTYHYKIYSYNGSGASINYRHTALLTGNQATSAAGADTTPPQPGSNTTPTKVTAGSSVNVSLVLTDTESGVTSAKISYGPATSNTFTVTDADMTNNSGTWAFTIPTSAQSELGVRYSIIATNGAGLTTTIGPTTVSVEQGGTGVIIPYTAFGSAVSNYRIIAIPLNLTNKTVNSVLGDNLGTYGDQSKWRMFRYSSGQTQELNGSSSLESGRGYWLIATENSTLDTGPGQSAGSADSPVTIPVTQGWNQIGNPYGFNLAWSDISAANTGLGLGNLRVYRTGSGFADATVLNAAEGGFVFVNTAGTLTFSAIKNASVNGRQREPSPSFRYNSVDSDDWELRLSLQSGTSENILGGFGMHPEAQSGFDQFDDFTLPRFGRHLEINHNKKLYGSNFTRDVVAPAPHYQWQFEVESSGQDAVTMQWSNTHLETSSNKLALWDVDKGLAINMDRTTQYQFQAPRRFVVYYGDETYISSQLSELKLTLSEPYPNPSAGPVQFQVWIPDQFVRSYKVEVLDMFGKVVSKLLDRTLEKGSHEIRWHPSESEGAGLYLLRLSDGNQSVYQKLYLIK